MRYDTAKCLTNSDNARLHAACWAFLSERCSVSFKADNVDSDVSVANITGGLVYLDEYYFRFQKYPDSGHGPALIVSLNSSPLLDL